MTTTESPARAHHIAFTAVADAGDTAVSRGKRTDSPYTAAIAQVAGEHPIQSPWFAVPGDDEKAQAKALRQIRAAAKAIDRRVLTGTHSTTHQPVWALGGPPLARKVKGTSANPSISADVEEGPTDAGPHADALAKAATDGMAAAKAGRRK